MPSQDNPTDGDEADQAPPIEIPEDEDYPREMDVGELMEAPEGTVRVGDEFHDPDQWQTCPSCSVWCPASSSMCFNCKRELDAEEACDAE